MVNLNRSLLRPPKKEDKKQIEDTTPVVNDTVKPVVNTQTTEERPQKPKVDTSGQPKIIRDNNTGEITGWEKPNGEVVLLPPTLALNQMEAMGKRFPSNTVESQKIAQESTKQQQAIAQQQEGAQMAAQVGENLNIQNTNPSSLDIGQAIKAGIGNALPTAATFATGAGIIGAVGAPATAGVSVPAAAGIGGTIGLISGFYKGVSQDIARQRSQAIGTKTITLTNIDQNMKRLITDTNLNPQNSEENLLSFNHQIEQFHEQYRLLNQESNNFLNKYVGKDAQAQLLEYENFKETVLPYQKARMQDALINPNPSKVMQMALEDYHNNLNSNGGE